MMTRYRPMPSIRSRARISDTLLRIFQANQGQTLLSPVFSNTEMSLRVGGSRSGRRSWEVSEWKGDVEGHEGPVQALSGPLLGC